jgi:hypothetical protein
MKTILEVMADKALFGPFFKGKSWNPWKAMLAGLFGLPMSEEQTSVWRKHTGRSTTPAEAFKEAWLVCGRRSGKSRISAFVATYLATFIDWRPWLAPGEIATVMLLASDRRQVQVLKNYIDGFFDSIPILRRMVTNRTADTIELENQVEISIHTSSFRAVRGYSIAACLCDEIGFWQDGDSSNPASQILAAVRPAQATFPKSLLLCFSSPYARRGVLFETWRDHYGKDSPVLVWQAPSRSMNSTISLLTVELAKIRDRAAARSEWEAEFRSDLESLFDEEVLAGLIASGRLELPPVQGVSYIAFTDPSGGQSDSFTLAIAHSEENIAVLDVVREIIPPFSPEATVKEYCDLLKSYGICEVHGDRYAANWSSEQFLKNAINYRPSERSKSEIYLSFLPMVMSGQIELLDHKKLLNQFTDLERRTRTGGRDSVDHSPGAHDDIANAVAGVMALARSRCGSFAWVIAAGKKAQQEQIAVKSIEQPTIQSVHKLANEIAGLKFNAIQKRKPVTATAFPTSCVHCGSVALSHSVSGSRCNTCTRTMPNPPREIDIGGSPAT